MICFRLAPSSTHTPPLHSVWSGLVWSGFLSSTLFAPPPLGLLGHGVDILETWDLGTHWIHLMHLSPAGGSASAAGYRFLYTVFYCGPCPSLCIWCFSSLTLAYYVALPLYFAQSADAVFAGAVDCLLLALYCGSFFSTTRLVHGAR